MTKHWLKISLMLAIGVVFTTTTAMAALFDSGDVFASTGSGTVKVYDPTAGGTLLTTLTGAGTGFTTGSVINNANGNFYVTDFDTKISVYDNNGTHLPDFGTCSGCSSNESILIDGAGHFWVGNAGAANILEFSSGGTLLNTFHGAVEDRGNDWIDLAADQHTMYYTSEGTHVKRFDTATNTQLADLNAVALGGSAAYALRILGDGSVLVADSSAVVRLSAGGALLHTYLIAGSGGGLFALNLDPNGTSFWTGDFATGKLWEVNIASGAIENTIDTGCGSGCLFGVSISGEITVSQTPEASQLGTSLALIGLLALFGYRRSKAKKAAENA